ncbi:mitochondrial ribosomal protein L43 [Talaromyces proteolyticus]|uniref:Large ribosomal subunit protein mL43 n=1 Tax=Talaromyces proteolyticus TaxID=1131652 RepID=A0AAD4Q671_9EURO|nr:mitochondrial ribosomal protein L43 [Talaromyces proteolyticus]KAH8705343.1 mitochondrial ribosomal protein L43 [Talaromyces proteolyticus]
MTVRGLKAVTQARNGVGAFILQCKRLEFTYCDWGGSSKGMLTFLKEELPAFARANPQIEFRVSPRPNKHPVIKGHYVNGRLKSVCVRSFEPEAILEKVNYLKQSSGEKLKIQRKPVMSLNESVRGIWSPYHGDLKMI